MLGVAYQAAEEHNPSTIYVLLRSVDHLGDISG